MLAFICAYWKLWAGIFILQGLCGMYLFEKAWKRTERIRLGEEACYAEFPSYRRRDSHMWSRSVFYPGCFLLLIPRIVWIFFWLLSVGMWQLVLF